MIADSQICGVVWPPPIFAFFHLSNVNTETFLSNNGSLTYLSVTLGGLETNKKMGGNLEDFHIVFPEDNHFYKVPMYEMLINHEKNTK
jgi:hypothetical protein